jgi:hypothetical protein
VEPRAEVEGLYLQASCTHLLPLKQTTSLFCHPLNNSVRLYGRSVSPELLLIGMRGLEI